MKISLLLAGSFLFFGLAGCQPSPNSLSSGPKSAEKTSSKPVNQPSIKGVRLGDDIASLKARYSNTFCPGDQQKEETGCIVNGISYATAEGMMLVSFVHGKAVSITVQNIDPSSFGTVSSALTAKFGAPNNTYAQFLGEPPGSLVWGSDSWLMAAAQNFEGGKGGVLLIDRAYLEKRLVERTEKAEGDL